MLQDERGRQGRVLLTVVSAAPLSPQQADAGVTRYRGGRTSSYSPRTPLTSGATPRRYSHVSRSQTFPVHTICWIFPGTCANSGQHLASWGEGGGCVRGAS